MSGRIFWGIILILLGVGFLFDQIGYVDFGDTMSLYWPSIIVLVGILGLFDRKSSRLWNLIVIAFGVLLQLNRLDYITVDVFKLFVPIVLILFGISIIFSRGVRTHSAKVEPEKWNKANATLEDTVDTFVMFSGLESINQSQSFKGGKVTAIFGGIDLDLRNARLNNNEAFLDVSALFGGVDIYVPRDWRVEMKATPILGGCDNNSVPNPDPNAPVLKISGVAIFGGIGIEAK